MSTGNRQLPCQSSNPELFFSDSPVELAIAKQLCAHCPVQLACLEGAISRGEPWGVWGGEIFDRGIVISSKRPRGRPRKAAVAA